MDVVKKIFENKEVHNGSAVTRQPNTDPIYVLPEEYGANLSGLVYQLKDKYKEQENDT